MRNKGTRMVSFEDIKMNLFVRDALDQGHVLYLAELIEGGTLMSNLIEVTQINGEILMVDGRHRKEAYELNGIKEVEVKILEFEDESEMIAYAYRSNTGGSKPPTQTDTEHTVKLLLERRESMKRIGELLGLPGSIARKYANQVKSRMNRAKLMKAVDLVTVSGYNVATAAMEADVEPEKLKEFLSTNRRKTAQPLNETHREMSKFYNGLGKKTAALIKRHVDMYEDGDLTAKQVTEVIEHIEELQRKAAKAVADHKRRFEARVNHTSANSAVA